jgi:hypothetical protein
VNRNAARLAGATVFLAIGTSLLAGCAGHSSREAKPGAEFVGEDAYQARYRAVVKSFPEKMPPGATFPPSAPPLEPGAQAQLSGGDAEAYFEWRCAWEAVYLSTTDEASKSEAMRQLRRWPHTTWARDWYEDPSGIWDDTLDAAELGDVSGLAEFDKSDCG